MMKNPQDDIVQSLKRIAEEIVNLDASQPHALDRVQRDIQGLSGRLPAGSFALIDVLNFAREGVLALTRATIRDSQRVVDAVAGAMAAVEFALLADDVPGAAELIEQARQNLQSALAGDASNDDPFPHPDPTVVATPDSPAITASAAEVYPLPADADADLVGEFINESRDYLAAAETALLKMEVDTDDAESINMVFRAFHTIKGTSAFLGITLIQELAHNAETLLSRVRDREIRCSGGYADLALRSADTLKELIQYVQNALGGTPIVKPAGYDDLMRVLANPDAAGVSEVSARESFPPLRLGDILVAQAQLSREEVENVAQAQAATPLGVAMLKSNATSALNVAKAIRMQNQSAAQETGATDSSLRVRTDRLDRLIDLVGELVIAQSMVAQDGTTMRGDNHELAKKVGHADKIARELQDLTMSLRMVPLRATFQKMHRLVRDLSHKSGKLVNLVIDGEDTEIDRNMVDVLNHPLVHMIRNACDHGIEAPDIRVRNGKAAAGMVRLSASHAGGSVVVKLQDDGMGLDRQKILKKAVEKGLLEADRKLSDNEIFNLIFEPGFSTAEEVTEVSGRGVGMDVVRRNVESLRGRVDIDSEPGKGSTFTIRLPLTLAITDGMLVKVGHECFIVPTVNIYLSFRPNAESLFTIAGRGELVKLREELMPVFRLHRLFDVPGAIEDPTRGLLVVVDDGDRRCALLVDELLGQHQLVAKTLGDGIGKVQGISGGAILGNGTVGLILDPAGIVAIARQSGNGEHLKPESSDLPAASTVTVV